MDEYSNHHSLPQAHLYGQPSCPTIDQEASYTPPNCPPPRGSNTPVPPGFTYTGDAPHSRDPLDPLPDAFNRPPDPSCTYYPLSSPIRLPAKKGDNLTEGFYPVYPAPQELLAHDVLPADFSRLLEDCHLMSKLSFMEKVKVEVLPEMMDIAPGMGFVLKEAIKGKMVKKKMESAEGLVEVWDVMFFRPRGLRASIQLGKHSEHDTREHEEHDHHGDEAGMGHRIGHRLEERRRERRERLHGHRDARVRIHVALQFLLCAEGVASTMYREVTMIQFI